ncbi:MAG: hypothetical protein K6B52_07245 [Clostridiales bacterium]|nr:hypothetical protein [Clostridiales bacterium]
MNKITAFALAAALMLMFCSCSGSIGENPSETEYTAQSMSVQSTATQSAAEEVNYEQAYAEKLEEVYKIVLRSAEKDDTLYDEEHEDLTGILESCRYSDMLDKIGYLIKDINEDGVSELILAVNEEGEYNPGSRILNMFTLKEGETVSVLEGWYRNSWYMLKNGKFFNCGSGGAAYLINAVYGFSEETQLKCEDIYFTAPGVNGEESLRFLHNPDGLEDENNEASVEITEEEFNRFQESCCENEITLDLTPVSRIGFPEIKVGFLDDAETVPDDFETYTTEEAEGAVKLLFTSDEEIKSLTLCSMAVEGIDEDGNLSYSVKSLKTFSRLKKPLVAEVIFYGDLPNNAFSITDKFGNEIYFAVNLSGEDGSVQTYRIYNPRVE